MEWAPLSPPILVGNTPVQLLAAIVESSDDAIVAKRLDGTVLTWNRGAEELYGYSAAEMVNQNIAAVIPADRANELAEILARVGAGERIQHYETVRLHKDGSILDVSVTISPIVDAAGEVVGVSTIARDITRQKRMQELLAHRALHDALTNLPNRVLLRDRIEGALARAERHGTGIAVFFLDLDRFKVLNDTHGHAAGDEILQVIADRLREAVRADDTVARFGGDEFVIVCHDVPNEERATTIAHRVAAAIAVPVSLHAQDLVLRASIGVVLGRPGAVPDTLVQDADTAMYQAKQNTRSAADDVRGSAPRHRH
jgi:diguanylate cyclase (GGDEF)-like protein/PAS domain S-box-containing protein